MRGWQITETGDPANVMTLGELPNRSRAPAKLRCRCARAV